MADPTPEELQTQIDELRSLITTQYEPPTGTEYSYPVVNQPMNDEMWAYVTRGIGDGVLDEGGQPYWFRGRENVNNTVRITVSTTTNTAQAILKGFYHKLTADKTFTVPAVSKNTTYYFCLTYDPAASTSPGGPISLQMYAGTPPATMGRAHIVLWELDRKPNQLLTAAEYRRVRPKVSPTITVDSLTHLPDPAKVLWGTQCFVSSEYAWFQAVGSSDETGGPTRWMDLTSPEWTESTSNAFPWVGHGYRPMWRVRGDRVEFRGRVKRSDGSAFVPGGSYTLIPNCPDALGSVQMNSGSTGAGYPVFMNTGQAKPTFDVPSPTSWIDLNGFFYFRR